LVADGKTLWVKAVVRGHGARMMLFGADDDDDNEVLLLYDVHCVHVHVCL